MVKEILLMNKEKADHMRWRAEFEHEKEMEAWKIQCDELQIQYESDVRARE